MNTIDDRALDSMSVAPGKGSADSSGSDDNNGDAGADRSIDERLKNNPESKEARLDAGLDESMDASDPPSSTQPVHSTKPAPSSGYDEEAEKARDR
ncbi:MAG: hypothetical protein OSB00_14100 [Sphingomonas bacterium]|nr:hypothetical protein [Sphingomonas bacterium]